MNISLSVSQRIFFAFVCFTIAVIGFMVKLPPAFRHMDKELHAAFYFLAAAFLNVLFVKTKFVRHVAVFIFLFLFGAAIEFGQSYSNRFFRNRIHGRFDPEDIQWNVMGLVAFSLVWVACLCVMVVFKQASAKANK